jgi:RimJ/RimL family protein N-acetyltransferase
MLDHPVRDVKMGPIVKLVHLNGRHASDLALLAADEWDVLGFVVRAQRLRARGERETFAVLDAGRLVGLAMLGRDPSVAGHAELGYWIGPRERGLGFATAAAEQLVTRAFGRLAVTLVFAHCAEDNRPSARVLAKLGFRVVGQAREPTPAGQSTKRYELTSSEWRPGIGST